MDLKDLDADQLRALLNKNSDNKDDSSDSDVPVSDKSNFSSVDDIKNLLDRFKNLSSSDNKDTNSPIAVPAQYTPGVSNPGPVATTGLNPNNPGPTDNRFPSPDDSDDDDTDSAPAAKAAPQPSDSNDDSDDTTDDTNPDDEATINGQSVATLKDLQAQPSTQQTPSTPQDIFSQQALKNAQVGARLQRLVGGLAYGLNPEAYKAYMSHNAVTDLQEQQAQTAANNTNQLQNYKVADEKTKNDMGSAPSQFARNSVATIAKQAGITLPTSFNQMSASDIEGNPILDKMLTAQSNNLTKQMLAQQRLQQMQQVQGTKSGQQQNQALQQTTQMLESARGNPAAAQAEKDLYASQKLNSLVGNGQNLSPEMVQLAASEVAKIAQGGVPTSEELKGLKPNTIPSKLASLAEQVQNQPVGANAQAFLKQYQDYAGKLSGDAQKVITDKYGRIIETNKGRLGSDNYKALQDNYVNRFKNDTTRAPQSQSFGSDVMSYAQQHGITPEQAQAIKSGRTGGQ